MQNLMYFKFADLLKHFNLVCELNSIDMGVQFASYQSRISSMYKQAHAVFVSVETLRITAAEQCTIPMYGANTEVIGADPLDLPFPCVWLECMEDKVLLDTGTPDQKTFGGLSWLLINELAPRQYEFAASFNSSALSNTFKRQIEGASDPTKRNALLKEFIKNEAVWVPPGHAFHPGLCKAATLLLSLIQKKEMGTIPFRTRIKIKQNGVTEFKRIKNVVVCGTREDVEAYAKKEGKEVDWSHQWEVRGHWRTVSGIGKDRTGTYCVSGFTWVINHIKGTGTLIKKTRVFTGLRTKQAITTEEKPIQT